MGYDKYSKLTEKVILKLAELNSSEHLTYKEIGEYFPDETKQDLKRSLESREYAPLFHTECECKKGGLSEDMYLLSIEGERLTIRSKRWYRRISGTYNKPIKLFLREQKSFGTYETLYKVIPLLIAIISLTLNLTQFVQNKRLRDEAKQTLDQKGELDSKVVEIKALKELIKLYKQDSLIKVGLIEELKSNIDSKEDTNKFMGN